ncbi:MAG: hypothetical protein AB7C97_08725 [Oscillospiraceae bacterium]
MKKSTTIVAVCLIAVSVILAVISFLILPDMVTVQVTFSGGAGNTMPKLFAVALPFVISIIFAVIYCRKDDNKRYLFLSLLGIAIYVITWAIN